ncbi:MAG: hypothetical protein HeimC2_09820 [Candidatus Heimdallarchaeota archaeon LC_2]|nr:MAG: hypothetical protein HeimC2_09820 [Candidatus Heimdallarchaeota archaeon LC_2]
MSELSSTRLDYREPRTIWVLGFEFFYTIIAMIPLYYYFNEILEIRAEAENLILILPISVAILLFFLELRLNTYFWFSEKTYKKRDLLTSAIKSVSFIIISFYLIFLLVFGYWLGGAETYSNRVEYQNEISQLITELGITLISIYFILILMLNIQNQRFERIFKDRFHR